MSNTVLIKGVAFQESDFLRALQDVKAQGFTKAEFKTALVRQGVSAQTANAIGDLTRRIMLHLKQKGWITYQADLGMWVVTNLAKQGFSKSYPNMQSQAVPYKTLSLPNMSVLPQLPPIAANGTLQNPILQAVLWGLRYSACALLLLALMVLNGLFAWNLGQENIFFRAVFVMALLALDLLRPLLIAQGLHLLAVQRSLGVLAIAIGLSLSPVSLLSSTAILSTSLQLGVELQQQQDLQFTLLDDLEQAIEAAKKDAQQAKQNWELECNRGGCGPIAAILEGQYLEQQQAVQNLTAKWREAARTAQSDTSTALARMVQSFKDLGIFQENRPLLLPLILAICLEIAALFAPALLLRKNSSLRK